MAWVRQTHPPHIYLHDALVFAWVALLTPSRAALKPAGIWVQKYCMRSLNF